MPGERSTAAIVAAFVLLTFASPPRVSAQANALSAPMPVGSLSGLQLLLASPVGPMILTPHPALSAIAAMKATPENLQALGPLAASLPADFIERVRSVENRSEAEALARTISQAYGASVKSALSEIDSRSLAAARTAAENPSKIDDLKIAAENLRMYAVYGQEASVRVSAFSARVSSVHTAELARTLARKLEQGLLLEDDETDAADEKGRSGAKTRIGLKPASAGVASDRSTRAVPSPTVSPEAARYESAAHQEFASQGIAIRSVKFLKASDERGGRPRLSVVFASPEAFSEWVRRGGPSEIERVPVSPDEGSLNEVLVPLALQEFSRYKIPIQSARFVSGKESASGRPYLAVTFASPEAFSEWVRRGGPREIERVPVSPDEGSLNEVLEPLALQEFSRYKIPIRSARFVSGKESASGRPYLAVTFASPDAFSKWVRRGGPSEIERVPVSPDERSLNEVLEPLALQEFSRHEIPIRSSRFVSGKESENGRPYLAVVVSSQDDYDRWKSRGPLAVEKVPVRVEVKSDR